MKKRIAIAAGFAAVITALTLAAPAQAAPADPSRWLQREAAQMGCANVHREALPMGPRNISVVCVAQGQTYNLLYYRRIGDGIAWWRHWVRGGNTWMARDGLVLVVPLGAAASGVDTGAYNLNEAAHAARRLHGVVVPI